MKIKRRNKKVKFGTFGILDESGEAKEIGSRGIPSDPMFFAAGRPRADDTRSQRAHTYLQKPPRAIKRVS